MQQQHIKRVVILGAGMSGVGAAMLASQLGHDVFVSDGGVIKDAFAKALQDQHIPHEMGGHDLDQICNADIVIKSPGIPDNATIINQIKSKGIPVISEIEFASTYTDEVEIAITGSNGKTTVTSLIGHVLKMADLDITIGGNIGHSYAEQIAEGPAQYRVLEVSSFQLDGIQSFKPHIAVLLNITPDHLDRYDYNFDNYIASKMKIASNQDSQDYLIYNADDPAILLGLQRFKPRAQLIPFSLTQTLDQGAYLQDQQLIINLESNPFTMSINQLSIKGQHNVANAMAAATTAKLLQIRKETIRQSLTGFQGVEHRLESVLTINKVHYINDSKATNINATYYALDSMDRPTVWIVGGVDKGNDYTELFKLVNNHVKAIICLGIDNSKIIDAFSGCINQIVETASMDDAVRIAYRIAQAGDNVLLSPACASFDLFDNYEDRGRQFKQAVRSL